MFQDSIILLSTKLCAAMAGVFVSFVSAPILAMIEGSPPWIAEYGATGMMCGFLVYALKILHNINQKLQKDWREDRLKAEDDRIKDRTIYYDKLAEHVENGAKSREALILAAKEQSDAFKELSNHIKTLKR